MASVIHEFASLVTVCDDGRLCSIENKRRSQLKCGNCDSHFWCNGLFHPRGGLSGGLCDNDCLLIISA